LLLLQARSQEARSNWETALDTKDRAITQLEEALESSKRAVVRSNSSQQPAAARKMYTTAAILRITVQLPQQTNNQRLNQR
jgi:hypothetical protein